MGRTGVILANTGSPTEPVPEAVRDYLRDFLTDPRIRPMNPIAWNLILNAFILPKRSVASANKYAAIWEDGGSPLEVRMHSLARKLEDGHEDVFVRAAGSYGSPSMRKALSELHDEGCERIIAIPLYPQSAHSTTEVVRDKLTAALQDMSWEPDLCFVDSYHERDAYVESIAKAILDAGFTSDDKLLMAFHSIPMRDIRNGDTYDAQANATARALAKALRLEEGQWCIGFQSRFDKSRKWLGPATSEALEDLADSSSRLFVVAPNFSIDCLETFHDIDEAMRRRVEDEGMFESFHYVACLNDSDAHVALLRGIIAQQAGMTE